MGLYGAINRGDMQNTLTKALYKIRANAEEEIIIMLMHYVSLANSGILHHKIDVEFSNVMMWNSTSVFKAVFRNINDRAMFL
jgi:hypothetical protein